MYVWLEMWVTERRKKWIQNFGGKNFFKCTEGPLQNSVFEERQLSKSVSGLCSTAHVDVGVQSQNSALGSYVLNCVLVRSFRRGLIKILARLVYSGILVGSLRDTVCQFLWVYFPSTRGNEEYRSMDLEFPQKYLNIIIIVLVTKRIIRKFRCSLSCNFDRNFN